MVVLEWSLRHVVFFLDYCLFVVVFRLVRLCVVLRLVRTFCFVVAAVCCCVLGCWFSLRDVVPPTPGGKRVFQILESDKLSAMNSEYLNPCLTHVGSTIGGDFGREVLVCV